MAPSCPMTGGGFRGPPVPLLLVPIVIQLVRSSCDPKLTVYLKEISKGGPMAIAENAHRIAQYVLSKVPSNVLYWITSKVLNLPPDTAMQTTEFLKSRSDLETLVVGTTSSVSQGGGEASNTTAAFVSSDLEQRLEKLELEYQALQENHNKSLRLLTYKYEDLEIPRELPLQVLDDHFHPLQIEASTGEESMQLTQLESSHSISLQRNNAEARAVLQDVGLRLGRTFLEWAGDTIKQSLVAAASRSSANSTFVEAGVDLASRLVDAVVA